MSIVKGTLNPLEQRFVIHYSPTSGYTRNWDYRGASSDRMMALMQQYTRIGCEATYTLDQGVSSLAVTDPSGQVTLDTWQLQQQDLQFSSLENPRHNSISATDLRTIARAIQDGSKLDDANAALVSESTTGVTRVSPFVLSSEPAKRLWWRLQRGQDHYITSQYILRHTTNASSRYQSNIAETNVDKIYTNAQLISEATNTTFWRLPLPPEMVYFLQNLTFPDYPAEYASSYQNGWLKKGSSRSTAANFRIELATEYWFGQISIDEYGLAT